MRIQPSGDIGIGTQTPAALLEVNGNVKVDGNLTLSGSILSPNGGAIIKVPSDGSANTAIGLDTLSQNPTGFYNTASGTLALYLNTSGRSNTANGWSALSYNNIGSNNTANGAQALSVNTFGNSNTASGFEALYSNTTGSNNAAVGVSALGSNTTGNNDIAIGDSALLSNTTGTNNIAIGSNAGDNVTSTSNNIHIGNLGTAGDSGTIRIGTTNTHNSTFIAGIYNSNVSGLQVQVNSNGQLGVSVSSRRYKEDIRDMGGASSGLMRLRPVTFRYKRPFDDGSQMTQYGLIAEEVAEVYPDLVARSLDGQIETVKYQLLDPMLLNELQKQETTISAQKEQIRSLEERLTKMEAALQQILLQASSR